MVNLRHPTDTYSWNCFHFLLTSTRPVSHEQKHLVDGEKTVSFLLSAKKEVWWQKSSIGAVPTLVLLLLGDTDSLSATSGGLGVLTANTDTPVVTKTTMGTDLLQAFQIFTELVVQKVSHNLVSLAWRLEHKTLGYVDSQQILVKWQN